MAKHFIKAIALSAVVMVSTATIASAQSLSPQDNSQLTPRQNLNCESTQLNYLAKPLGKQIKVSTRCVEGQSTHTLPQQSKVCSVYFDQYKATTDNEFQISRSSCFAPKSLNDSLTREIEHNK